jgi:hypothetical protein
MPKLKIRLSQLESFKKRKDIETEQTSTQKTKQHKETLKKEDTDKNS